MRQNVKKLSIDYVLTQLYISQNSFALQLLLFLNIYIQKTNFVIHRKKNLPEKWVIDKQIYEIGPIYFKWFAHVKSLESNAFSEVIEFFSIGYSQYKEMQNATCKIQKTL